MAYELHVGWLLHWQVDMAYELPVGWLLHLQADMAEVGDCYS